MRKGQKCSTVPRSGRSWRSRLFVVCAWACCLLPLAPTSLPAGASPPAVNFAAQSSTPTDDSSAARSSSQATAALTASAPSVKLQPSYKVKAGRLLTIKADTSCKTVEWFCPQSPTAVDLLPLSDGRSAVFVSPLPGSYEVYCYTAAADVPSKPARTVISVLTDVPVPPVDAPTVLADTIRPVFAADSSADKSVLLDRLASLYKVAGSAQNSGARNPAYQNCSQLLEGMRQARRSLPVADDALPGVRKEIERYLDRHVPTGQDKPLTDEIRKQYADAFTTVGRALDLVLKPPTRAEE